MELDIRIYEGNHTQVDIDITKKDGAAFDLTGATEVTLVIAEKHNSTPIIQVIGSITEATTGKARFIFTAQSTLSLNLAASIFGQAQVFVDGITSYASEIGRASIIKSLQRN